MTKLVGNGELTERCGAISVTLVDQSNADDDMRLAIVTSGLHLLAVDAINRGEGTADAALERIRETIESNIDLNMGRTTLHRGGSA